MNSILPVALTRPSSKLRSSQFAEEEIPALTGLAELRRLQGDCRASRDMLDLAKEVASRGPYPLLLADALNVLLRRSSGTRGMPRGGEAATTAYRAAWCDGPPYAYHWGLQQALFHLDNLGCAAPCELGRAPALEGALGLGYRGT